MNYFVSLLSAPTDADWLSVKARALVTMCKLAEEATPELHGLLVSLCEHCGGVCHEMEPCGRYQ